MRRNHERSGFTLIEVAIAASMLGAILLAGALISRQGLQMLETTNQETKVEDTVRRAANRILRELENTSAIVPDPDPAFVSDFVFTGVTGVLNGAPVPGDPSRLFWRLRPGEADDGVDNDGNGLIDEGEVVFTRDLGTADERTIVLVRGVPELLEGETLNGADDNGNGLIDEPGFCVVMEEELLVVRLTAASSAPNGRTTFRTIESGLRLRD